VLPGSRYSPSITAMSRSNPDPTLSGDRPRKVIDYKSLGSPASRQGFFWIAEAKRTGVVQQAIETKGLKGVSVAPY
jgi:hypothetical protein